MPKTEELDDEIITQETDTTDYKALLEKERSDREKRENRFKSTAKELNEIKARVTTQTDDEDDAGVNNANEYLKSNGARILREEAGFLNNEDFQEKMDKYMKNQKDVEKLDKFPQLATQKEAILQLSKVDGLSIEETIKKYKFIDDDSMDSFHKPTISSTKKTPATINWDNPTEEDLQYLSKMSPEELDKILKSS